MNAPGKVSGLARSLEVSDPLHRLLLVLALIVAVLGGLWSSVVVGVDPRAAVVAPAASAVASGAAALLAWAVARELDPDHPLAALWAAALALPLVVIVGFPAWLAVLALLMAVRALNGSTGRRPVALDYVVLAALVGGLAYTGWRDAAAGIVAVLLLAAAVAGRESGPWLGAGLAAVAAAALRRPGAAGDLPGPQGAFSYNPRLPLSVVEQLQTSGALGPGTTASAPAPGVDPITLAAAMAGVVLFLPVVAGWRRQHSVDDASGAPLQPGRVLAGQVATALLAVALVVRHGGAGLAVLGVVWPAMVALGVAAVVRGVRRGFVSVR